MVARQGNQARVQGHISSVTTASPDNVGTTPVRPGFELDVPALAAWLVEHVGGYQGPLQVDQFRGGQSNPTYKLTTPGRCYVLRRKPDGVLLNGAHAIEREVRIIGALEATDFPVPAVYGVCTDESVIGSWFYVMALVEGRIFWDATLAELPRQERSMIFDSMNATIAKLHLIDHESIGLSDYGRPGNYFERQIARWSKQYLEDPHAGRDPNMDRLIEWLPANVPASSDTSLVHGDFRIDNLIFDPVEPRVVAVLDWELSTLGDALADFAYNAMMYHMPPDIVAGLYGINPEAIGLPSEAAYINAYCRRTGRNDIPSYGFYIAFNFFRLAAIFHGIKGRMIRGTAASAQSGSRAERFPKLAAIAWDRARYA